VEKVGFSVVVFKFAYLIDNAVVDACD